MKKFVTITEDFKYSNIYIKKHEVGIVQSENHTTAYVQFVEYDTPIAIPKRKLVVFNPAGTGDNFDFKVCNRCNRLLPVNNFQKNQNGKNNRTVRRPSCNDCRDKIDGKDMSASQKREWGRTKPNMEIWECPICKKRTIPGLTSKVVLDHNHITGEPNAWICDSCNTGLGRFNDDTNVMEEAIKYLKKYKK